MTIDEAIAHAREVAQRQRNTQVKYFGRLTCDSIEKCRKCEEEHEQLAEWLEELKSYRTQVFSGDMTQAMLKENQINTINKAMEKATKAICIGCGYLEGTKCTYKGANCQVSKLMLEVVVKALEEMKVGEEND